MIVTRTPLCQTLHQSFVRGGTQNLHIYPQLCRINQFHQRARNRAIANIILFVGTRHDQQYIHHRRGFHLCGHRSGARIFPHEPTVHRKRTRQLRIAECLPVPSLKLWRCANNLNLQIHQIGQQAIVGIVGLAIAKHLLEQTHAILAHALCCRLRPDQIYQGHSQPFLKIPTQIGFFLRLRRKGCENRDRIAIILPVNTQGYSKAIFNLLFFPNLNDRHSTTTIFLLSV
ncbi:hypothetical protein TUMEXPCC7403_01035 [Tumidithrix helvetica PCC 7403]